MKRYIVILFAAMLTNTISPLQVIAQDKTVTLVVSGEASTKDEATKQALRSAIEQAFGTFVSANTTVVNDQIIRDEIISVTTGNIQSYKEIATAQKNDGTYCTSVEAVVSIGKLQTYAQNKGMSTELAGNTLTMNVKLKKLNIENEKKAVENMFSQMIEVTKHSALFNYSIASDVSFNEKSNQYFAYGKVKISANKNLIDLYNYMDETIHSLSEKAEYAHNEFPYCGGTQGIPNAVVPGVKNHSRYKLMNDYNNMPCATQFYLYLFLNMINFEIKDNLYNTSKIKILENPKADHNIEFVPDFTSYSNKQDDILIFGLYNFAIKEFCRYTSDIPLFCCCYGVTDYSFRWSRNYTEEDMNKLSRIDILPYQNFNLDSINYEDFCRKYMFKYSRWQGIYKPE